MIGMLRGRIVTRQPPMLLVDVNGCYDAEQAIAQRDLLVDLIFSKNFGIGSTSTSG